MALTKAQIIAQIDSLLASAKVGGITAANHRQTMYDIVDTAYDANIDGVSLVGTELIFTRNGGVGTPINVDLASLVPDLTPYLTITSAASTYEPLKGPDDNYVTDAEKVVIGNTSGTNSGDNATNSQYSGLATSKQDTLVNQTNIKSINGTTLLGSGDLSVGGGAVEGTAVLSTGETVGKVLQADGDNTCSWVAIPGGGDALTSNPLSQFAATTSAQLAGVITNETGSGNLVFATSPTLVTPALGTPSSVTLTNATGLPIVAGTTGTLSVARGGTGVATLTGIVKGNGTSAMTAVTAPTGAIVGTTDTQTLTNKTLTSPAISTPTGIVKGDVDLGNVDNTSDSTKNSATATLTNKRITMRVQSVASSATVTPNAENDDSVKITAQAAALTLANPSGTPTNMQPLTIRIKDNGTARAISYGTQYRAIGLTLPTTTVISKTLYLGMIYNSDDTKWDVVGYALEA